MSRFFNKKIFWTVLAAIIVIGGALYFSSPKSAWLLWEVSANGRWFLPVLGVAALADSINPCAFSILILTIAFLFSLGKMRKDILKIGLTYILGIFVVYLAIGLGILQALHLFNTPHFMAKLGAGLLILFGLIEIIDEIFPAFPLKLRIPQAAHTKIGEFMNKASIPAAFLLGGLVGLCEFPCTGGPYLMVLGMLHDSASFTSGLGYLLLYNLIFVLPLVIILTIAADKGLLKKVQSWKKENTKEMRWFGGIAMILLGFLIYLF